jgi:NADH-quinone oxidoreductase subunit L
MGQTRMPKDAHPHEATTQMLAPLMVLAVGSVIVGIALGPTGILGGYMHNIPHLHVAEHGEHHWWVVITSGALAIGGVMAGFASAQQAWTFRSAGSVGKSLSAAGKNRFYIDEIYSATVIKPLELISAGLAKFDVGVVDGLWRQVAELPRRFAAVVSFAQCGQVGFYSAVMAIGFVAYLLIISFA